MCCCSWYLLPHSAANITVRSCLAVTYVHGTLACAAHTRANRPPCAAVTCQESTTNRYQVNLNNMPVTIVQTNNKTRNYALLTGLDRTKTYDVVRTCLPHPSPGRCR